MDDDTDILQYGTIPLAIIEALTVYKSLQKPSFVNARICTWRSMGLVISIDF